MGYETSTLKAKLSAGDKYTIAGAGDTTIRVIKIDLSSSPSFADVEIIGPSTDCVDNNEYCSYWAGIGECEINPGYMLENCKKSCGVCNQDPAPTPVTTPVSNCVDNNEYCSYWAGIGECEFNPGYMLENCKKSSGVCNQDPTPTPVATPVPTPVSKSVLQPTMHPTHRPPTMYPTHRSPTMFLTHRSPTMFPTKGSPSTCAVKGERCNKKKDCCKRKCKNKVCKK